LLLARTERKGPYPCGTGTRAAGAGYEGRVAGGGGVRGGGAAGRWPVVANPTAEAEGVELRPPPKHSRNLPKGETESWQNGDMRSDFSYLFRGVG